MSATDFAAILRADTDTGTPFSLLDSTLPVCDMLTRHRRARPDRTAYQGPHRAIPAPLHVSALSRMTTRSARTSASASAVAVLLGLREHITVCRTATVANEETHAPTYTHTRQVTREAKRARARWAKVGTWMRARRKFTWVSNHVLTQHPSLDPTRRRKTYAQPRL